MENGGWIWMNGMLWGQPLSSFLILTETRKSLTASWNVTWHDAFKLNPNTETSKKRHDDAFEHADISLPLLPGRFQATDDCWTCWTWMEISGHGEWLSLALSKIIIYIILVGGCAPPLWKKYKVSWDYDIPNIWKNKIHVPNHQPVYVCMGFIWVETAKLPICCWLKTLCCSMGLRKENKHIIAVTNRPKPSNIPTAFVGSGFKQCDKG